MRIEQCKKCKCILDVTEAPKETKEFYCDTCFNIIVPVKKIEPIIETKPIIKKKKQKRKKLRRIPNVTIYRDKEELPEGVWVTVDEIVSHTNKSLSAIRTRIHKGQYKIAYIKKGSLLLDAKSYRKKTYTRKGEII